jgi:hypothetical protein
MLLLLHNGAFTAIVAGKGAVISQVESAAAAAVAAAAASALQWFQTVVLHNCCYLCFQGACAEFWCCCAGQQGSLVWHLQE